MYIEQLHTPEQANDLCNIYHKLKTVKEPGMYRDPEGVIWRVKSNIKKTNLYAQRILAQGGRIKFQYVADAIYQLTTDHRMTLAEGKEYAISIGACIVCGRTLTDQKSIERGIGPICEKQFRQEDM